MAYVIGLVTKHEREVLEMRGWEIEEAPKFFTEQADLDDEHEMVMIYVDSNVLDVMSGESWEMRCQECGALDPHDADDTERLRARGPWHKATCSLRSGGDRTEP